MTIALLQSARGRYLRIADVQRDMDLIRNIMLAIEAKPDLELEPVELAGVDELLVSRHVEMLHRAGFVEGMGVDLINRDMPVMYVKDLTWQGHEFLASIKNDTVYAKLKQALSAKELSGVSLQAIADVALDMSKAWLRNRLGLDG